MALFSRRIGRMESFVFALLARNNGRGFRRAKTVRGGVRDFRLLHGSMSVCGSMESGYVGSRKKMSEFGVVKIATRVFVLGIFIACRSVRDCSYKIADV